jgi:hypothetical protein
VIVTGTRQSGLEAAESPAPIQIVSAAQLSETGKPDLMSALSTLVPSFVLQAFGNGQINGVPVPGAENITAALIASGLTLDPAVVATGSTGINLFANGINTRTKGVDYVLNAPQDYLWGHVDWSVGATWNETTITHVIPSPAELGGQPLFDATAYSDLTTTSPKVVVNFGMA